MASNTSYLFVIVALLLVHDISSRTPPETTADSNNIAARLNGGGLMECWDALYELKSCTNEIVLFFLNGETKLGVDCCHGVEVITNNCWQAMLTSLGFTSDETNVLRGFCQSPNSGGSSPAPSSVKL
ncbi:hypothetical protein CARUB_v10025065mg [Capsella rubella]|uniref:Prolamin-like domain-containing protein n=1 Tax=Capsella rubella TaxID=81985 RepID=R0G0U6_9BRAS|nr:egg cell-secreted protein 1.2 [Capsella rubella]EOA28826.1 hypothetical protein CARUB_v10025065mg [Capsella rubella]